MSDTITDGVALSFDLAHSAQEPYVAVDPADPTRLAVAAMVHGAEGEFLPRTLHVWQSRDSGATWRGGPVHSPQFQDGGAFDPVVSFATDGTLLVAGMSVSAELKRVMSKGVFNRSAVPSSEQIAEQVMDDFSKVEFPDTIVVVRVGPECETLGGVVIRGSGGADKPAIAVDHHPDSPYYGSVYVAWHDMVTNGMLQLARSSDGGRSFDNATPVIEGPPWGPFMCQMCVRPDGSLHVIWAAMITTFPSAPPDAATSIWHVASHDGGHTFGSPLPIARHAGLPFIGIPAVGMDPQGAMLVVWGQGSVLPSEPLGQVRHELFAISSDDAVTWSAPRRLLASAADMSRDLPAVASDGAAWWVLAYEADDAETRVILLRSIDGGDTFCIERTLARRPIPVDDIFLHGNYQLRRCTDVVQVGDYVGLAMSGSTPVAAYALPASSQPMSKTEVYVHCRECAD